MAQHDPQRARFGERRSHWRRFQDRIFGYDFFISYAWVDGGKYARELAERLEELGYEVFLDSQDYASGDDWQVIGSWTLKRTGHLILVGSDGALQSEAVAREVWVFGRTGRQVIPIDFGGSLDRLGDDSPLARAITPEVIRVKEAAQALADGPSNGTVHTIGRTFKLIRQDKKRATLLGATAFVMSILAASALVAAFTAFGGLRRERSARAGLEARLAPRRITPEQHKCLVSRLKGSGIRVGLADWRDDEALGFSGEITAALKAAGVEVRRDDFQNIYPPTYGLLLAESDSPTSARVLSAFKDCGLEISEEAGAWGGLPGFPEEVHLYVGAKPSPFR